MSAKTVAYLVVCWNNEDIIDECLTSIEKQTYPHKRILVLDNNSADNSVELIRKKHSNVELKTSDENTGFARGNNILIAECLKDPEVAYIALINSDLTLDPGWTDALVAFAEPKQNIAGLQGTTLDYFNHSIIDSQHIFINDYFRSVQYGHGEKFQKEKAHPRKVFGVNAAAALYTLEFIKQQRGERLFDEKFYMYLEDVDVALRSVVMGWDNYYVADALAYHMGSVSAKKRSNTFSMYMIFRNQAALLFKSLPFSVFIRHLKVTLAVEKNFYKQLRKVEGKAMARSARRGRWVGLLRLPLYMGERVFIRRRSKVANSSLDYALRHDGLFSK